MRKGNFLTCGCHAQLDYRPWSCRTAVEERQGEGGREGTVQNRYTSLINSVPRCGEGVLVPSSTIILIACFPLPHQGFPWLMPGLLCWPSCSSPT